MVTFAPVVAIGAITTFIDNRVRLGFDGQRDIMLIAIFVFAFGLILEVKCGIGLGRTMVTVLMSVILLQRIMWRMTIDPDSAGSVALIASAVMAAAFALNLVGLYLTNANPKNK